MKKIAFLNKYQGKVNRGAETFVKEVSQRLSKKYEVDVISNINYLDLFKSRYDLIIPTNGRFQVILVRLISWLTGGKMIVSGQSGMGWDDRLNLYSFPNYFIPLSPQALRWARKVNPYVKSVYIPNGVDVNKFKKDGEKIPSNLNKPVVLCVAALSKTKRVDLVIRAVAKVPDLSLFIAGKGEEEGYLNKLGEELLKGRFEIRSFTYEEMPKVYRIADIFTLVSKPYYSFENGLVEAMATNLPVVANNDPIRKEIVKEAGVLVDPTNIDEYAKAIQKAINTDWKDVPRKQAEKFNWNIIARKYIELIEKL